MRRLIRVMGVLIVALGMHRQVAVAAAGASFDLTPNLITGQKEAQLGYFQRTVTTAPTGTISVTLANLDRVKARTFRVQPVAATTTDRAEINYSLSQRAPDSSAQLSLPEVMTPGVTVTLAPRTKRQINFGYHVPPEALQGTLLGSVYAVDQTDSDSSGAFTLTNRFAMAVGVVLVGNAQVTPQLKLGAAKAAPTAVTVRVRNVAPAYFRGMNLTAVLQGKKRREQTEIADGAMAPTSWFEASIPVSQPLAAGVYQVRVTAKVGQRTWQLAKRLVVPAASTARLAVRSAAWWWLGLAPVAAGFGWVWYRRRAHGQR